MCVLPLFFRDDTTFSKVQRRKSAEQDAAAAGIRENDQGVSVDCVLRWWSAGRV